MRTSFEAVGMTYVKVYSENGCEIIRIYLFLPPLLANIWFSILVSDREILKP